MSELPFNIIVSGADHTVADAGGREALALDAQAQRSLLARLGADERVLGAAVLSTCGRTEVYLSLRAGAAADPFELAGWGERGRYTLAGEECFRHLALLGSGALSQIFGEDQILAQIKRAAALARECRAADTVTEVMFREATASAKRMKTRCALPHGSADAARAALEVLRGKDGIKRVLVIGSGEIGRMAARTLCAAGYEVTMTLRRGKSAPALPPGVRTADYESRYALLPDFDAAVSATASAHRTIELEPVREMPRRPRVFIDLAMPRDVDPEIAAQGLAEIYDIDGVSSSFSDDEWRKSLMPPLLREADEGWRSFLRWAHGREALTAPPKTHFPLFIECTGQKVLVIGGGVIAERRAIALAGFDFDITVVAPEARSGIVKLAQAGRLRYIKRKFEDADMDGTLLVVAATDDRAVNRRAAVLARHLGIYCSVSDCRAECSFFFPALAQSGGVTIGLCGTGENHHAVAETAKRVREALNEKTCDRQP